MYEPVDKSLVSVIIPCFNHAQYLPAAIESVQSQTHKNIEIIVVDDGSTDDTKNVCLQWPEVKYVYQSNQGLSASRNTGIKNSIGEFLVFLDADDILYPSAIATNLNFIKQDQELAFVSGSHDKRYIDSDIIEDKTRVITGDYYCNLLEGNYIAMIAAVMFRRSAFDTVQYDTSLKACEDYDVYLKVARKHKVYHHTNKIACYHIYESNMSANIPLMLHSALTVLRRQRKYLNSEKEINSYRKGISVWQNYFSKEVAKKAKAKNAKLSVPEALLLFRHNKKNFLRYLIKK